MYVELDGEEILLCRHKDEYFAVAYFCSHAEFALEGGSIRNGCITCPYHGAEFDLRDGSVQAPPAFEPVKTYPVRIQEDTVSICATPNQV
jgi:3-phenylpropionate/trans-cinnamate dioxygenase ferredoxin subunit